MSLEAVGQKTFGEQINSAIENSLNIMFEVCCNKCSHEFKGVSHEYDCDFSDWILREAVTARQYGWTEDKEKVYCPLCIAELHSIVAPKKSKTIWQRIWGK